MAESPSPAWRRYWPPPPPTAKVREEQTKLTAGVLNAGAIACLVTGFVGPVITTIPDEHLPLIVRAALVAVGILLHLAGRTILRYMNP